MKTFSKKIIAALLASIMVLSVIGAQVVLSSAANYSTSYSSYATPANSGDYAYWNGSKVVRSSNTAVSEVKWMQCALNYCIVNEGLSATKLDVDGSFGPASKSATLAFQKAVNKAISNKTLSISKLSEDGSFGPATIQAMKKVLNDGKATFKTFTQKNYLQVDSDWSLAKKYNNSYLRDSGCGILSIVNAVYNCTGNEIYPTKVADWAYNNKYFNNPKYSSKGGGICNNNVFKAAADNFGSTYGFKYVTSGTSINSSELKNYLKNGSTAIVHVTGHYMTLVGYNESNGTFHVFDSAPGSGTSYNSINRKGLTSKGGDWKTAKQLSTGNLAVTGYWIYSKR